LATRQTQVTNSAERLAVEAARVAHDNRAEDIVVLDLRGFSPITNYFVICTGTSDRQMRTVADHVCRRAEALGDRVWKTAGVESGTWIVLDFVDVVVHIFDSAHRSYYDLELIWGAAPRVAWRDDNEPASRT